MSLQDSGISVVDFQQVNTCWNVSGSLIIIATDFVYNHQQHRITRNQVALNLAMKSLIFTLITKNES